VAILAAGLIWLGSGGACGSGALSSPNWSMAGAVRDSRLQFALLLLPRLRSSRSPLLTVSAAVHVIEPSSNE
jgi:hypothetical protein